MHFISKIIEGKIDDSVHRRFIKFSKGLFMNGGPVVVAKLAKNGVLSLNGSYEYEDLIGEFASSHLPDGNYSIKGTLYSQPRVPSDQCSSIAGSLGLNGEWEKGKRDLRNLHFLAVNSEKSNAEIKEIYSKLSDFCTILLNITPKSGKLWNLTTKDKIPSLKKLQDAPMPSCKPDKAEKCAYLNFCEKNGICVNDRTGFVKIKTDKLNENQIMNFVDVFLPDFKDRVNLPFKELVLANQYMIEEFVDPPNKDKLPPKELKEKIIRKGHVNRILLLDNKELTNKIGFEI